MLDGSGLILDGLRLRLDEDRHLSIYRSFRNEILEGQLPGQILDIAIVLVLVGQEDRILVEKVLLRGNERDVHLLLLGRSVGLDLSLLGDQRVERETLFLSALQIGQRDLGEVLWVDFLLAQLTLTTNAIVRRDVVEELGAVAKVHY